MASRKDVREYRRRGTNLTMNGQAWRARISLEDGRVLGSGSLIDPRRVLTCAHVVSGHPAVVVSFLEMPGLEPVQATVGFCGPWTLECERGDVAVLELAFEVSIHPARFARLNELADRRLDPARAELHVYGFPRGYDQEGADTQVHAPYRTRHEGEWAQLEAVTDRGIRLQAGFSGAAVSLADTGEVVGMVVGADRDKETRTGKMLPLEAMCDHWPPLANYLPVGRLTPPAWNALHELLMKIQLGEHVLKRIYSASLPDGLGPEPPHFESASDMARFLAEEVIIENGQPLARFCMQIARVADDPALRAELDEWRRTYLSGPQESQSIDTGPSCPEQSPAVGRVVVRLTPSGDPKALILAVAAVTSSAERPVFQRTIPTREVRRLVEQTLPEAIQHVPTALDVMIEFELPARWLNKPVHEWWYMDHAGKIPVGWAYPVVVRVLPPAGNSDRPRRLDKRWHRRSLQIALNFLDSVNCRDGRDHNRLTAWLLANTELTVLALANPPKQPAQDPALRAGLFAGVPVMLWARQPCVDDHADDSACRGDRFLNDLAAALTGVPLVELPNRVRVMRAQAGAGGDDPGGRCGSLTLFWDQPRTVVKDLPLGMAE